VPLLLAEGEDQFDVSGRESKKKKASLRNAGTDMDASKQTARSSFMRDFVDSSFDEDDDDDATDKPVERAVLYATDGMRDSSLYTGTLMERFCKFHKLLEQNAGQSSLAVA